MPYVGMTYIENKVPAMLCRNVQVRADRGVGQAAAEETGEVTNPEGRHGEMKLPETAQEEA